MKKAVFTLVVPFMLSSCGSSPFSGSSEATLEGMVSLGPVQSATVKIYKLEADGSRGDLVGEGLTDSNGRYSIKVQEDAGACEVVATGGEYQEEASGATVSRAESEEIRSVVDDIGAKSEVAITPLTELATERAKALKSRGVDIKEAIKVAVDEIEEASGVTDIIKPPADPRTSAASQNVDETQKKYALVLAGLSQMATDKGAKSMDIVKALSEDFKQDGTFDGASAGSPVAIENSAHLLDSADWKDKLPAAMNDYIAGEKNHAGFQAGIIPTTKDTTTVPKPPTLPPLEELPAPIASKVAVSAMTMAPKDQCVPILLKVVDSYGRIVPGSTDTAVTLTLPENISLFSDLSCSVSADSAQNIPGIPGVLHLFIKSSVAAKYSIELAAAAESGLTGTSMSIEITALSAPIADSTLNMQAAKVLLRAPGIIPVGACVPVKVLIANSLGMPVPSGLEDARVITVASSNQEYSIYGNSSCTEAAAPLSFAKQEVEKVVYVKAAAPGKNTLVGESSGLTSGQIDIAFVTLK